jgi:8-oxo-dGTP pyrophosphatase MutT (NUDIX family)
MGMSDYYQSVRARVGDSLLMIPAVAAIVRDREGRVLVHQRPDDSWSLPAGSIEPGETPAQAVVRETYEETGLQVRPNRVAGVVGGLPCRVKNRAGHALEYLVTLFDCSVTGGELLDSGDETKALAWVPSEDLPSRLSFPYPTAVFQKDAEPAFFQKEPIASP